MRDGKVVVADRARAFDRERLIAAMGGVDERERDAGGKRERGAREQGARSRARPPRAAERRHRTDRA